LDQILHRHRLHAALPQHRSYTTGSLQSRLKQVQRVDQRRNVPRRDPRKKPDGHDACGGQRPTELGDGIVLIGVWGKVEYCRGTRHSAPKWTIGGEVRTERVLGGHQRLL
jgi:hypothetical protein